MKNCLRILFAIVLCMTISQSNVEAQIFKKALSKVKGAVGSVVGGKAGMDVPKGPAKPQAPDVKNFISEVRVYTGLTKEAFLTKIKSQGYVLSQNDTGMPLDGEIFKSKSTGYYLAVKYGTREGATLVRDVSKAKNTKSPVLTTVKKTFLDYGKECTNLKAEFTEAYLKGVNGSNANVKAKSSDDWSSKFLPAFDKFISAKEMGMADQSYREPCYTYSVTFSYVMGSASIVVRVIDLTIEGQEG